MFELKKISPQYISNALMKAEKYRYMNHPKTSESICRDVLEIKPEHQEAIILLIISISEQFADRKKYSASLRNAQEWLPLIEDEYKKIYLSGLILERWAKANIHILAGADLYEFFQEAMDFYAKAEKIRPVEDESCILHWNLCIRLMELNPHIKPRQDESGAHAYGDGFVH